MRRSPTASGYTAIQTLVDGPGVQLGKLFTRLATPFNLRIAHQDRRVVVTQQPKVSALAMGEKLIQGDRPIVEYRRRRHEWMEDAEEI